MLSWFKRPAPRTQTSQAAPAAARAPLLMPLEPRIMFDVAVGATAVEVVPPPTEHAADLPVPAEAPAQMPDPSRA